MKKTLLSLVVLSLLATACADPTGPALANLDGTWQLDSGTIDGDPIPLVDGHPITLTLDGENAGGTAACNGYGGTYQLSDNQISFSDLFQTEMACMPEEIMDSEGAYLAALGRVDTIQAGGESMTLTEDDVELHFSLLPPVVDAGLNGTVWVLDGLIQGDAVSSVSGDRATLELYTDGSMLGATGCRTFNGHYTVDGDEVAVSDLSPSGQCGSDLESQDAAVIDVLGEGFSFVIDGTTLTLNADSGQGLVYRRED
jgi:heat shock protein HslJ